MSHITGPGSVLVSLRFGQEPEDGPLVTIRTSIAKAAKPTLDVERYVAEVLEGVSEANRVHSSHLEVEEIEVVPDDYPTEGQVRYCATKLAEHTINCEQDVDLNTCPSTNLNRHDHSNINLEVGVHPWSGVR